MNKYIDRRSDTTLIQVAPISVFFCLFVCWLVGFVLGFVFVFVVF